MLSRHITIQFIRAWNTVPLIITFNFYFEFLLTVLRCILQLVWTLVPDDVKNLMPLDLMNGFARIWFEERLVYMDRLIWARLFRCLLMFVSIMFLLWLGRFIIVVLNCQLLNMGVNLLSAHLLAICSIVPVNCLAIILVKFQVCLTLGLI
jgi:hypothetical protein